MSDNTRAMHTPGPREGRCRMSIVGAMRIAAVHAWIKQQLAAGKKIESLKIQREPAAAWLKRHNLTEKGGAA